MKFVPAKCPSCNGELQVPDDKDFVICMYCGVNVKVREAIKVKDVPPISLKPSNKFKNRIEAKDKARSEMNTKGGYSLAICIGAFILLMFTYKVPVLSSILAGIILLSLLLSIIFFLVGASNKRTEAEETAYKMTEAFDSDEEKQKLE